MPSAGARAADELFGPGCKSMQERVLGLITFSGRAEENNFREKIMKPGRWDLNQQKQQKQQNNKNNKNNTNNQTSKQQNNRTTTKTTTR